ncbi:MAG: GNAT family N-acetyltransferase [Bryobacterales bacterium]|nr:GNAT family N-acetyltransferase [Bryobacterales bacterium]
MAIDVRPMLEQDLATAEQIFRVAFGTAHGVADPARYMLDRNYIRSRWAADPGGALVAELDGEVAGSVLAAKWGSVGVLGPLTVDPRFWNSGVAGRLLESTLDLPVMRESRLPALSTAAGNVRTVRLYQRFDFWPGYLIPILGKMLDAADGASLPAESPAAIRYSALSEAERFTVRKACAALTDAVYGGLDLSGEIQSVERQALGETLLLRSGESVDAFAICHCGAGSEAGEGACYIKFGAARTPEGFELLLKEVEALAQSRGLGRVIAGVNAGRRTAYGRLLARGFTAAIHSVSMSRFARKSYDGTDALVLDDWR